ncbi:esterase-like activity of phytase-domain-containing protein [Aspergillus unguis]
MATRTSSRHAAQKAKEAISAAPDTKRRGSAGTKRKESTEKGPQPKRGKKNTEDKHGRAKNEEPQQPPEKVEDNEQQAEQNGKPSENNQEKQEEHPALKQEEPAKEPEKQPETEPETKPAQKPEDASGKPSDASADGTDAGMKKSGEREEALPSNILEKGLIYFFYRGRVNVQEAHGVEDVARSFFILRPTPLGAAIDREQGAADTGAKCRLMMLPKKKYPRSGKEREMGFVEKAGTSMKELQDSFIAGGTYQTSTRGEREIPEAKPYAEGVYAMTSTKRATHIVYHITLPEKPGEIQKDFGLAERGSWLVQSKNPKFPSPPFARLPKDPEYPQSIIEKFRDLRWIPAEPELLDYPNAQWLMIGSAVGDLGKAATAEEGDKRPKEEQPEEELIKMEDENEDRIESLGAAALAVPSPNAHFSHIVNKTTCGGKTYAYTGLEGYGFIESNARDKYGDTLAGLGSSAALEKGSWHKSRNGSYEGVFWLLPDRGWNTNGTLNFIPRIHKFSLELTPSFNASARNPSAPNVHFSYLDTILLSDPHGQPLTGLDPDFTGSFSYEGFPPLPGATYVGNGFGGSGPGGKRVSLDPEGLVIDTENYFWISDEYGPFIYRFDRNGTMVHALQPPEAYLPRRNGSLSFSAASPPLYAPNELPNPEDPETGRNNNQGFEGLTLSEDGKILTVMIQSALNQEGGPKKKHRQPARVLQYDISDPGNPQYKHEYAVNLPKYVDYTDEQLDRKVASQSEILQLPGSPGGNSTNFLVLSRDSGFGGGSDDTLSVYRHADIFSVSNATTDLKGAEYDSETGSIADSDGILNENITPAEYCSFLDFNVESELAKFGLHNGGEQEDGLLNEKWESFVLVPVEPELGPGPDRMARGEGGRRRAEKREYFLFTFNDNDFITQDGAMNFGRLPYVDESGLDLNSQALVFRVEF